MGEHATGKCHQLAPVPGSIGLFSGPGSESGLSGGMSACDASGHGEVVVVEDDDVDDVEEECVTASRDPRAFLLSRSPFEAADVALVLLAGVALASGGQVSTSAKSVTSHWH